MSDSFQILRPSSIRPSSRLVCSSGLTSSQYFSRMIPALDDDLLELRDHLQKAFGLLLGAEPITRSTPARLYQLRSKIIISPAAGRCGMYRWAYI